MYLFDFIAAQLQLLPVFSYYYRKYPILPNFQYCQNNDISYTANILIVANIDEIANIAIITKVVKIAKITKIVKIAKITILQILLTLSK